MIRTLPALTPEQVRDVVWLSERCTEADGTAPLNEVARLGLESKGSRQITHFLIPESTNLVGYAAYDHTDRSVQACIDPEHRNFGLGTGLLATIAEQVPVDTYWAFGDLPAARQVAEHLDLVVVRRLLIMRRGLDEISQVPVPDGVTIGPVRSDELDELVRINAAAFAHHPEQGSMTRTDLDARLGGPQALPDILVARDARGRVVGFHWTKTTGTMGEVYVIGVDPARESAGVGRALLVAGLHHMVARGATEVELYVEAANERVVAWYTRAGFTIAHIDTVYAAPEPGQEN